MNQKIVVNAARSRFYCWFWDRWKSLRNLRRCFKVRCLFMYEPEGLHLRTAAVRQAAR